MVNAFNKALCAMPRTTIIGSIAIFFLIVMGYPIYSIAGDSWPRNIGGFFITAGIMLAFTTPLLVTMDILILRCKKKKLQDGSQYDSYELCAYGICERWECNHGCREWQTRAC